MVQGDCSFLVVGEFGRRELTKRERRRIRGQARRYRRHQGEERGLFYEERGGKLARCIVEEEVEGILGSHKNKHGYFAGRMLNLYLLRKA